MTRTTTIIQGVLAGIYGAGCMSVLRMAARRAGVIDVTPPQETKRWLAETTGIAPRRVSAHQVLDTVVHLAVGGGAGAMYGALVAPAVRPNLAGGAGFGLAFWAAAFGVVMPALGITRSLRRSTLAENAVNAAAHVLYGLSLALVTGELARQGAGDRAHRRRFLARVG